MELYYGIFFVLAFASFIEMFGLRRSDDLKIYLIFSLMLFAMSFLRWETGTDWDSYYDYFVSIPDTGELLPAGTFEVGYIFLNGLAKILSSEYTMALFLCGLVLFAFQSPAIWKLSPYPIFSLLFFFCVNYAGVFFVRQTIAGAILLYSVIFIRDRRFWLFAMCVGISVLFHNSSIIFILAYWVYRLKLQPLVMIVILLASIAFAQVADGIMQSFGDLVGGAIKLKIDAYTGDLSGDTFGLTQSFTVILIKAFFSKGLLIVAGMIMLNRLKDKPEFRGYMNLYWFGAVIYFMTVTISVGLARMAYSFDILQIVLLPYIIQSIKDRNLRLFVIAISFAYIALRLYTATTGGYYDLFVPYKTIFTQ